MKVKAWNTISTQDTSKLIIGTEHNVETMQEAMNQAEKLAKEWNKRHKKDKVNQINFLTCNGFIRTI